MLVDDSWCSGINGAKTRMQSNNCICIKSYQTAAEGRKQNGRRCTLSLGQQEIKKCFPTGSEEIFSRQTLLKDNQKMSKRNVEKKKAKNISLFFSEIFIEARRWCIKRGHINTMSKKGCHSDSHFFTPRNLPK